LRRECHTSGTLMAPVRIGTRTQSLASRLECDPVTNTAESRSANNRSRQPGACGGLVARLHASQ
jgi:hypothetical protein